MGAVRLKPRMNGTPVLSNAATEVRLVKPLSATTPASRRPRSWRTRRVSNAAIVGSGVLPVVNRKVMICPVAVSTARYRR
jgi:hypothetical protein